MRSTSLRVQPEPVTTLAAQLVELAQSLRLMAATTDSALTAAADGTDDAAVSIRCEAGAVGGRARLDGLAGWAADLGRRCTVAMAELARVDRGAMR